MSKRSGDDILKGALRHAGSIGDSDMLNAIKGAMLDREHQRRRDGNADSRESQADRYRRLFESECVPKAKGHWPDAVKLFAQKLYLEEKKRIRYPAALERLKRYYKAESAADLRRKFPSLSDGSEKQKK
jgi:hypothetical protein